jgi:hypothetical protein
MSRRKQSNGDKALSTLANSLTTEQVISLYQFIQPLTADEQAEYDAMDDDDLLGLLTE